VSGVRAPTDSPAPGAFEAEIKRHGGDLKQFDVGYFTVEINQKDDYAGAQRLVAIQPLPTGFEGVDRGYRSAWPSVIGNVVNPAAVSENEYSEFQDDRWIALPEIPAGRQHHLLAFSLRPTLR